MLTPWWQPMGLDLWLMRLRPGPRRRLPPLAAPLPGAVALPVFGPLNPFQYGAAVIDPGSLFFRAGNPIGGPSDRFRGVSASTFPFYAAVRGPGAPLAGNGIGIAGTPI